MTTTIETGTVLPFRPVLRMSKARSWWISARTLTLIYDLTEFQAYLKGVHGSPELHVGFRVKLDNVILRNLMDDMMTLPDTIEQPAKSLTFPTDNLVVLKFDLERYWWDASPPDNPTPHDAA